MRSQKNKHLTFFQSEIEEEILLPDYGQVKAGFPSPAEDFTGNTIDLNKELIRNKETTFIVRVHGESMRDVGIDDGDLLLVDKSLEVKNNKIAVCFLDGEFTVKRIKIEENCIWLIAENNDFKPIKVDEENELIIWGIVTNVIKYL
jgi:DNA polymerase V